MKVISLLLLICLFGSRDGFTQSAALDSLKKVVENAMDDETKVRALFDWSELIYETSLREDVLINKKVLEITSRRIKNKKDKKRKQFLTWHADANHNVGHDYLNLGNPKACIYHYEQFYAAANELCGTYKDEEDLYLLGDALMALSSVHSEMENYDFAYKYALESKELREKIKDSVRLSECYGNLGLIYVKKRINSKDSKERTDLLSKAFQSYYKSLDLAEVMGDDFYIQVTVQNLAKLHARVNNADSSMHYYRRSEKLSIELDDQRSLCYVYAGIADVYDGQNNYQQAIKYAENSYDLAVRMDYPIEQIEPALTLYKCWKKLGNTKKALHYFEKHQELIEDRQSDEAKKALLEQQARFDYRLKEEQLLQKHVLDSVEIAQKSGIIDTQEKLSRQEGQLRWGLIVGLILLGVLIVFIISRMRIIRKQKRLLDKDYLRLKEFTENASHEMQTPMAVIYSKLDGLMQEQELSPKQREQVQTIYTATYKMSTMNRSLLLLARIENSQFPIDDWLTISDELKEAITDFEELIEAKGITLSTEIKTEFKCKGSKFLTQTIFSNLVKNAMNHNVPRGDIKIVLADEHVTIENSGEVLDANPEELFERFKKSGNRESSTGLGLAIVRKSCEAQGWRVSYQHEKGRHSLRVFFV